MRMFNLSKTLSITVLENVSIGEPPLRFFPKKVLHLLDFLPPFRKAAPGGPEKAGVRQWQHSCWIFAVSSGGRGSPFFS